jgi:rod shape-determining protein MreB and related proteins
MGGLGIDLGTANTVVCHSVKGIILDEPSIMVFGAGGGRHSKVIAIGQDGRTLLGRTRAGVAVARPLQDGVVGDLETARTFIAAVLRRLPIHGWERAHLRAVIGVPAGATALERRALIEAAHEARIRKVSLMAEPIAGAIGCGLDPLEPLTHMVVDVGGGTAEVTAFCYGDVVAHRSCRLAGDEMTLGLYQYLRQRHQLVVSEYGAEDVKIRASVEDSPSLVVEGTDALTGRPRVLTLEVDEVDEALRPVTEAIIQALTGCLEDLPPRGATDVMAEGVLAFGGGALARGFNKLLEAELGFSVHLADRPLTCVAEGAAQCVRQPAVVDAYSRM